MSYQSLHALAMHLSTSLAQVAPGRTLVWLSMRSHNLRVEEVSPVSTMHIGFIWSPCSINNLQAKWFGTPDASRSIAKVKTQKGTVFALFAGEKEKK